eukprot:8239238-Alexandrium_andersonii.AAC.1
MPVKSAQLGLSRYSRRATMTDSPRGQGRIPSTEAPPGAPSEPPETGAVLFAKALRQGDSGRRFAAPQ